MSIEKTGYVCYAVRMAWSDPNDQSFFTTGWQLFTAGLVTIFGCVIAYHAYHPGVVAHMGLLGFIELLGFVLLFDAVFVWIAKLYERFQRK